jgi:hypothetical protein
MLKYFCGRLLCSDQERLKRKEAEWLHFSNVEICFCHYWIDIQLWVSEMAKAKKQSKPAEQQEINGVERLGLRVSSMINHPVAQTQRWVTIHRLDTDGDREWEEVMGVLSETDGIDMTFNDDESVTLRWEASAEEDRPLEVRESVEEPAPF